MDLKDKTFVNSDGEVVEYDGSPVYWRVSAYAIIVEDGKVFLINGNNEKLYDVPGGGVELDESVEEAMKREALEEAGLIIEPKHIIGYHQDYFFHRGEKQFYKTIRLFFASHLIERQKPTQQYSIFADFVAIDGLKNLPILPYVKELIFNHAKESA